MVALKILSPLPFLLMCKHWNIYDHKDDFQSIGEKGEFQGKLLSQYHTEISQEIYFFQNS